MTAAHSPLVIKVSNTTIIDDTPNSLLSRVVARIRAKGLHVVGIYCDGWETATRGDVIRNRTWEIDIARNADEDADAEGSVIVKESEQVIFTKIRGIGQPRRDIEITTAIGWTGGAYEMLNWRGGGE